jgi:hypothetical protein
MNDDETARSSRRRGPVYDDAMKILADDDLPALLSIVGIHGHAERVNAELAASTTKADLIARTSQGIVHVEFVKDRTPDLDLRMLDYRLRLRRRDRTTPSPSTSSRCATSPSPSATTTPTSAG